MHNFQSELHDLRKKILSIKRTEEIYLSIGWPSEHACQWIHIAPRVRTARVESLKVFRFHSIGRLYPTMLFIIPRDISKPLAELQSVRTIQLIRSHPPRKNGSAWILKRSSSIQSLPFISRTYVTTISTSWSYDEF